MKKSKFLAVDLGAESGRVLSAAIGNDKIELTEVKRFLNTPVRVLNSLHWDTLKLFHEIKKGIKKAVSDSEEPYDGIAIDTWGVDYGLLDDNGKLLGLPYHYRDERTNGMLEEVFKIVPRKEIFESTGIQFMQLNTLFQLFSEVKNDSVALKNAKTLLFTPDLLSYWLTGNAVSEYSIATTSQCFDPRKNKWALELLDNLGIPSNIMPNVVMPGTKLGQTLPGINIEIDSIPINVYAAGAHDTACAVASVPADGEDHAYISCGTWSLMGMELDKPLINDLSLSKNFTNEGGVCGKIRFLHNIMGLWLVQECRRTWFTKGDDLSYSELTQMASESEGFVSVVNPNDTIFLTPGDMPLRIQEFCKKTGQKVPETNGEIVRCALDSLALAYKKTINDLDELTGKHVSPIHMVGGGIKNKLLCQLTADATGRNVVAGPVEATAIGNVLVQAIGAGVIDSLSSARDIVRNSFTMIKYYPNESKSIDSAFKTFLEF